MIFFVVRQLAPALPLLALLVLGMEAGSALAAKLPEDVAHFVKRRDLCDHFRGEESDDPQQKVYIAGKQLKYCKGTDAQLNKLRVRYQHNGRLRRLLGRYETRIE